MKLTTTQIEALRILDAASKTREKTVWSLNKQTGGALVTRGLATVETYQHHDRYGRHGFWSRHAAVKYCVDAGYTITEAGRAFLVALASVA